MNEDGTELFPVGEYVADELKARGWTTAFAGKLLDGNPAENTLWLDFLCCLPIWEQHDIKFTKLEAKRLEQLFGVQAETWLNIHDAYLKAKRADDA